MIFRDSAYEDNELNYVRHFNIEVNGMSELRHNTLFLNVWLGGGQQLTSFLKERWDISSE